jgi:hypothetical protein
MDVGGRDLKQEEVVQGEGGRPGFIWHRQGWRGRGAATQGQQNLPRGGQAFQGSLHPMLKLLQTLMQKGLRKLVI